MVGLVYHFHNQPNDDHHNNDPDNPPQAHSKSHSPTVFTKSVHHNLLLPFYCLFLFCIFTPWSWFIFPSRFCIIPFCSGFIIPSCCIFLLVNTSFWSLFNTVFIFPATS